MDKIESEGRALELAIAKRIRQARLRLKWTLDDLAKATGLSKGHLSQIENGGKIPPISTLTKIVTMGPEFPPNPITHMGQEFVYTLEGIHEFYYDGRTYTLNPGDAVYFDSDRPHMGRSLSKEPAKVLVVFCNIPK